MIARFAALSLLILVAGCASAPTSVTSKPRRQPAYVRVCNLGSSPLTFLIDGQQAAVDLQSGEKTGFRITPPKDQPLEISIGKKKVTGTLACKDGQIYTIVGADSAGKPSFQVISGEAYLPKAGTASISFVHMLDGRHLTAKLDGTVTDSVDKGQPTEPTVSVAGEHTVTFLEGGKPVAKETVNLQDSAGHTAILWQDGKTYRIFFTANTTQMSLGAPASGSAAG